MVKSSAEALIECTPSEVFDFVAVDFVRNYPRWSPEVEYLAPVSEGAIQLGWIGHQVRIDKGRRTESQFEVVAFDHCRQLSFQSTNDVYRIDYWFEPFGVHTRVIFNIEMRKLGLALRPFESFVRQAVQESADTMMVNLKQLMEDERPPRTP